MSKYSLPSRACLLLIAAVAIPTITTHSVRAQPADIRDRIAYNLVFFAVLLMAASFLLAQLTAGQDVKIIKDLGLSAASAFGVFIAIFIGIGLVSKEVERRSIYGLISKPISRPQFVVVKYAGLVLTLALLAGLMVAPDTATLLLWDGAIPLLPAVFLINPGLWRNVCPLATLNLLPNQKGSGE